MKSMEILIKKHISHWNDEIAQANALGATPASLQKLEAALRSAIELVQGMAEDYDIYVSVSSSEAKAPAPTRRKKTKSG